MQTRKESQISSKVFAAICLWLAAVVLVSASGWLGSVSPYAPPFFAAGSIVVPSLCYFLLPPLRDWFASLGLRRLTALHIFRIAAVPLFFWYGDRNLLPQSFVQAAGWGDLAAGLLALAVVLFWNRDAGYWIAHILGMLDFVTAFATAIRLTNAHPDAMHAITGLPMALIPFFGVGVLATTHVIAYDLLSRTRQARRELPLTPLEVQ